MEQKKDEMKQNKKSNLQKKEVDNDKPKQKVTNKNLQPQQSLNINETIQKKKDNQENKKDQKSKDNNKQKTQQEKELDINEKELLQTHKKRILQFDSVIQNESDLKIIQGTEFNIIQKLHLDFWMYQFENPQNPLQNIQNFLIQATKLEALTLDLSECDLGDVGSLELGKIFSNENSQNLVTFELYLSNTGINEKIFDVLQFMFEYIVNVQYMELYLGNNNYESLATLKEAFKYLDQLKELRLFIPHCELEEKQIMELDECFSESLQYLHLDLSGNNMDLIDNFPPGIFNLPNLHTLELKLNGNFLDDEGVKCLLNCFIPKSFDKNIENEGGASLDKLQNLTIDFSSNELMPPSLQVYIPEIVRLLKNLKYLALDFRNNIDLKQDDISQLRVILYKINPRLAHIQINYKQKAN